MSSTIKNTEAEIGEVEEVETIDTDAIDDTAEILEDAKELSNNESEIKENESHEESVRQALADLSKDKADGDTNSTQKKIVTGPVKATEKTRVRDVGDSDPDLIAPARFDLKGKEAFNRAPPEVKKEIHRSIRDLEAKMTEASTKSASIEREWAGLSEAVKPFASEFGRMGLTVPQGVVALLSAQEALTNPKTSLATYIALGKDLGHDVSGLEALQGESSGTINLSSNPEFRQLQEENKRLREMVEPLHNGVKQSREAQEDQAVNQIATELNSVINEIDANGRYLNPRLHEAEFLEAWKPLVSAIARTDKTVKSWADAGKKAYDRLTGRSSGNGNQATPSSRNNRSVSAAISTRGRVAPSFEGSSPDGKTETEISINETPEQSARIALRELSNL